MNPTGRNGRSARCEAVLCEEKTMSESARIRPIARGENHSVRSTAQAVNALSACGIEY